MFKIAQKIIRSAVKTHGRAKVRQWIKEYKARKPEHQKDIELAFAQFAREQGGA